MLWPNYPIGNQLIATRRHFAEQRLGVGSTPVPRAFRSDEIGRFALLSG